jgi:hypothetical protein
MIAQARARFVYCFLQLYFTSSLAKRVHVLLHKNVECFLFESLAARDRASETGFRKCSQLGYDPALAPKNKNR